MAVIPIKCKICDENYKQGIKAGYAKALDDVLRIFDLCKGMTVEELKSSIAKLKESK